MRKARVVEADIDGCGSIQKLRVDYDLIFQLNHIMLAVNFGHYDARMAQLEVKKGKLSYQLKKAQRRFKRNLRFLTSYPEEVICEPMARVAHWLWRKYRLWRW